MEPHETLVAKIISEVGAHPKVRIWRNDTGMAFRGGKGVRYGLRGSSDILGLIDGGTFLAIEVKTGRGALSEVQRNFRDMVRRFGGIHIEARSVEDVWEALRSGMRNSSRCE